MSKLKTIKSLTLSADAQACHVKVEMCCGWVRVSGWIHATNQTSGIEAGKILANRSGVFSIGGCDVTQGDKQWTHYPFSFDANKPVDVRHCRIMDDEQAVSAVFKSIRFPKSSND